MSRRPDGRPTLADRDSVAIETCAAIAALRDESGGLAPTRKALAQRLGLSSIATVVERLGVLRRRRLVSFEEGSLHSLTLTTDGEAIAQRPTTPAGTAAIAAQGQWE